MNWSRIQQALYDKGFDPKSLRADGKFDGIPGRSTAAAVRNFQSSVGLPSTGVMDDVTYKHLFPSLAQAEAVDPPWMAILEQKMGLSETRDNKELREFLKSDGSTLGDPAKWPWCGDLIETIIAITMPREPLPNNPYLARNWAKWGREGYGYGAVGAFWRTSKLQSTNGHVATIIGRNKDGSKLRIRGGNQGNSISDVWIGADRLLASRQPITWLGELRPLPVLDSTGAVLSTNEA